MGLISDAAESIQSGVSDTEGIIEHTIENSLTENEFEQESKRKRESDETSAMSNEKQQSVKISKLSLLRKKSEKK